MVSFIHFATLSVLFQSLAHALPAGQVAESKPQRPATRYLFSFGDSYTATSFNIESAQPSAANPMGNPEFGTGSSTARGNNYLGWLTSTFNTTLTYTFNFAYNGATTTQKLSPNIYRSFEDQVDTQFIPKYSSKPADIAPWNSTNSIFLIFVGINDVGSNFIRANVDQHTMITATMQYYWNIVDRLYNTGARNYVFINIPPLYRSPYIVQFGGANDYAEWVGEYNCQLNQNVDKFNKANKDTTG